MSENERIDLARQLGGISEQLNGLAGTVDKISSTLHGNGKVGLIVEVDRHSQQLARSRWLLSCCIVIMLGLVFAELADHWKTYQALKHQATQPAKAP